MPRMTTYRPDLSWLYDSHVDGGFDSTYVRAFVPAVRAPDRDPARGELLERAS
jgi:hypothetical protein